MALVGRLHPLLIHFPIALVLSGFAAEAVAMLTGRPAWRRLAVASVRSAAVVAALASSRLHSDSHTVRWVYRISLLVAAALVGVAAHLGGMLVWGANFVRL